MRTRISIGVLAIMSAISAGAWQIDPTAHTVHFITVEKKIKLEVLDWGGSGRPLVLLTGMGDNAHVYDRFAPKLTGSYHVYGITRRGYGKSSAPAPTSANYAADRLGDDVLAVIDALKLKRPVLVGHSLGGEELSSVGSRHPEKVAGLIYLDAGYGYAYYDRSRGDLIIDLNELQRKQEQLHPAGLVQPTEQAILAGMQKYTDIRVPILAIFALPHERGDLGPEAQARDLETTAAQAKAFETGLPSAKVVRLPHANHYVFQSNEADVLREMNAFIGSLP